MHVGSLKVPQQITCKIQKKIKTQQGVVIYVLKIIWQHAGTVCTGDFWYS